jgi:3-deoxy-D-manno-octulosonic-acid transferase
MPSNHALNFFLAASFLGVVLRSWKWGITFGLIAFTVALSRVYLGVHYPSQVLVGAIVGSLLGGLAALTVLHCSPLTNWLRLTARKDKSGMYTRFVYSLVLYFSVPFVLVKLLWRGRLNHDYWYRWPERFGWFSAPSLKDPIWVHAVSVGEVQAALPLVRQLLARYPNRSIVVTTTTPTGSARVQAELDDSVFHVYLPYDLPGAVERFLDRIDPKCLLVMETEIWPNLFYQSRQINIPIVVANARLSQSSRAGYQRLKKLTQATLNQVSLIAAQGAADAENFESLGAPAKHVHITGSIKFDLDIPATVLEAGKELRQSFGGGSSGKQRPVWIAASTHEGEDEKILQAFAMVRETIPDALLILVPRHPERFSTVTALCKRQGFTVVRRSENKDCDARTQVFVGDTLGELLVFYAASDVAFVGGSLVSTGGHNVLEPAALGLPVVTGPHMFNFAEISKAMLEAGALQQVENTEQLAAAVSDLITHPETRQAMGEHGKKLVAENRGSLDRLLELVHPYIEDDQK